MRVAKGEDEFCALHTGAVTYSLDFQLFAETFGDTFDHVGDQRSAEAVHAFVASTIAAATQSDDVIFDFDRNVFWNCKLKFAFRAFYSYMIVFAFCEGDACWDADWEFADSGHFLLISD